MQLKRRIAALEAKLLAVSKRCRALKMHIRHRINELRACHMVKAELKRIIDELYQTKKDSKNT
jgi:regulator of replication initiation timing